jgi:hypothetical protein
LKLSMNLFRRKKTESLRASQGVPEGTFRCDICTFIQPTSCLCGEIPDASENPPKVYTICGPCALWLGLGTSRFQPGLIFTLSDKQRAKIKTLHQEIDISGNLDGISDEITALVNNNNGRAEKLRGPDVQSENFAQAHEFLKTLPNLKSLIRFRFSLLSSDMIELSRKLTKGEFVAPREIKRANK